MSEQSSGDYRPMPEAGAPAAASRGPAPSPVVTAARLLWASAVLGVLSIIATVATKDALRDKLAKGNTKLSDADLDTALNVAIGFSVFIGIVVTAVCIVLALQVPKGKGWARIVALVLCGLGVLFGLFGLLQPASVPVLVLTIVGLLIDIAIIVLLTRPASNQFFSKTV